MKTAACGHLVDVWYQTGRVVCKACFEAQGFQYNRNSYQDIDQRRQGSAVAGNGTRLRGADTPNDNVRSDRSKAEIAAILNPVLQLPGRPRHKADAGRKRAREEAFALVRERYGVGRAVALMYAKEFRVAA